jgi:hypothetical protein
VERVRDVDLAVIVRVGALQAGRPALPTKQVDEREDRIGDVDSAIPVRVGPAEGLAAGSRMATAYSKGAMTFGGSARSRASIRMETVDPAGASSGTVTR